MFLVSLEEGGILDQVGIDESDLCPRFYRLSRLGCIRIWRPGKIRRLGREDGLNIDVCILPVTPCSEVERVILQLGRSLHDPGDHTRSNRVW